GTLGRGLSGELDALELPLKLAFAGVAAPLVRDRGARLDVGADERPGLEHRRIAAGVDVEPLEAGGDLRSDLGGEATLDGAVDVALREDLVERRDAAGADRDRAAELAPRLEDDARRPLEREARHGPEGGPRRDGQSVDLERIPREHDLRR